MQVTLSDGLVLTPPDVHAMVIGPPNSGKTEFAASAEKPMVVLACDPMSKMLSYFNQGIVDAETYKGPQGQPIRIVRSVKTGKAIIQIECYYDEDEQFPGAMQALLARMPQIAEEVKQGRWRTVVIDSWTQLEWIAKVRRTFGPFAGVDSVYAAAKDDLQNLVNARLMNLRSNLIITFHIETKVVKDRKGNIVHDARVDTGGGEMSYSVQAIGTLKNIGNVLGECYLAVAPIDGSDNYFLQTRRDANFRTLCSRIGAPNPCKNNWNDLFSNWLEAEAKRQRAAKAAQPSAESAPTEGVK